MQNRGASIICCGIYVSVVSKSTKGQVEIWLQLVSCLLILAASFFAAPLFLQAATPYSCLATKPKNLDMCGSTILAV